MPTKALPITRAFLIGNFSILKIGVLLLTFITTGSVFWEKLLPFEADIVIGAMILVGFIARSAVRRDKWKKSILDKPVLILVLAMVVTLMRLSFSGSEYFDETVMQFVRLAMIMGLSLIVVQILNDPGSIQQVLRVFTLTVALISIATVLTLLFGISSVQLGGVEIVLFSPWGGIQARLGGVYEQPNTFATPLVLALPLGIAFAVSSKDILHRALWSGMSVIYLAGLLLSQARSAILGAFLGILVMIIVITKIRKSSRYLMVLLLISLGAMGVLAGTDMLDPVFKRLSLEYYVYQQITGLEPSRFEIWRESLPLAFHNPFGYGAETRYLVGEALGVEEKSAHNAFISFLTSMGVLGFIGILILSINPLRRLWQLVYMRSHGEWQITNIGLLAGLVGFWAHNLAHSVVHWLAVWIYFACVAAAISLQYRAHLKKRRYHE